METIRDETLVGENIMKTNTNNNNNTKPGKANRAAMQGSRPHPLLRQLSTLQDMVKKSIYQKHEISDHAGLPSFTNYSDLASEMVGGKIIFATDDWFATAENMLKAGDGVFKPDVFTEYGKLMDGWETRRRRSPGHDWCIIQLGCAGRIHGIELSTLHFTGNYPPRCSIQGVELSENPKPRTADRIGTAAPQEELQEAEKLNSEQWEELVTTSDLQPGDKDTHRNFFPVNSKKRITHIRLNIFPDGGVARLRVYGEVKRDWAKVTPEQKIDLVAMVNGGVCVDYSDAHYGHARNVIAPGRARKMDEGWETARRLDRPAILTSSLLQSFGGEWAIYRLGHLGIIENVEIDTNHFKGNFPHSFTLEGAHLEGISEDELASEEQLRTAKWKQILGRFELHGHFQHLFEKENIGAVGKVNHVRLTILPDGGISRMILMGHIVGEENEQ